MLPARSIWVRGMESLDTEDLRRRLNELSNEHGVLDAAIESLSESAYVDQLHLRRLKKRKLQIKDMISRIESRLIPDLDA